jgi:Flp pilus assembly protein TadD
MCQILAAAPEDKNLQAESLPTIEEIMTSNPEDTELLSSAAVMYASLGQNDVAITQLEKLLKIAPNHVLAQNNLATLLAEDPQRQEDGMVVIDQAIKVAGRQPALLDTKGTLLLRSGKFQEAVACLEEATIMPPVDPRYWLHLAQAYYELGDISAADQALTRAQVSHVGETLLTSAERAEIKQLEQNLAGRKPEQSQVE